MAQTPAITAANRPFARLLAEQGQLEKAAYLYSALFANDAADTEAALFLYRRAQRAERWPEARNILERAVAAAPTQAELWSQLAMLRDHQGDLAGAADAFAQACRLRPEDFVARLLWGHVEERRKRPRAALSHYFQAISAAQQQQEWRDPATTPANLRPLVEHAIRYVDNQRLAIFSQLLTPLETQYGRDALKRVHDCVAMYLHRIPLQYGDSRQKPTFLYFPGLPPEPVFSRERFPWLEQFEAQADTIRAEMQAILNTDAANEPFHRYERPEQGAHLIHAGHGKPAWNAFFFFRHGQRIEANHQRCPQTSAVLAGLPLVHIRDHGPEVCFSVLTAGTHILPHRGVTNIRSVLHLALQIPAHCALNLIGIEEVHWHAGKAFVFDDCYEHEAWNRSDQTRVILLGDIWNPHLQEVERAALTDLIGAIGDIHEDQWQE
ncbi:aspartyl beta-hydroxylase [Permianibacter sp. IMCC34836]|uniref:aspartyl/asparaginyl beta-hydroxylase domain-containing protein n=1 Tax=Permianibacter fluminis TaxID=2738515 RepID=UPI001554C97D|nr:aspartyl/asparaginyl beta-hydroxylase domain-containing protein [Permianibacter fluminis]NQD36868.1 aspartyl beta-hydroxylase [Permianibacter fluminis]